MRRHPIVIYVIVVYMFLAFGWWTVLLMQKNTAVFDAQVKELALRMALQQQIEQPADFKQTEEYAQRAKKLERQQYMVLGEAALLMTLFVTGLFVLYRNLNKEISAAEQQRNFLLSITHELKSPLAGIRLILETFQRRKQLKPELQEKLSTNALAETDRLTALVNDLLLSAKLENAYQLNKEDLDLGAIIQDAAERVAMKYQSANVHVDIEPGLPTITGDQMGMMSVAVNLLENAAKYSQPAPVIHTSLLRGGSEELIWEVRDNGMGIPNREKNKVFTKFYRVGNEDTRTTKGTGLGLFIVRQLVTLHGGQLELADNPGGGTIFRIFLPAA
ncbi:sensor histidine kinase [Neolewinella antarctica]|uniref:histidine kinase n=1 Tax=Neolewinella antarctica TaxID=442734 RepID=A0ABX0XBC9_9BACT|nr:ATP-binding protein [Neolewinella antarctica]NJC26576.1 signal transduction histidine kinase [Neolewinella antarctica]